MDGVSAEWTSTPCTAAEGELIVHLGLLYLEGDLIDWDTDLEIELPPLFTPSFPLVPSSPPLSKDAALHLRNGIDLQEQASLLYTHGLLMKSTLTK